MKKVICILLSLIFVFAVCSCSKEETPADSQTTQAESTEAQTEAAEPEFSEMKMIKQMLSDLSNKKFEEIASKCMLSDGTKIEAKSIESIYNYLTNAGVDPSQGIIVKKSQKAVNIGSGSESSHTYELTTLCGDKTIMFNTIIDKIEDDHFFTQIYVAGISDAADTTAATAAAE